MARRAVWRRKPERRRRQRQKRRRRRPSGKPLGRRSSLEPLRRLASRMPSATSHMSARSASRKRNAAVKRLADKNRRPRAPAKPRFTLHGVWLSGPTYKVGLMLSLSGARFSYEHVNLREGAHKRPEYLAKNRFGQVPCLST